MDYQDFQTSVDQDYLVAVDNQELIICNQDGFVVASSNPKKIGKRYIMNSGQNKNNNKSKELHFHEGGQGVTVVIRQEDQKYQELVEALTKAFIRDHLNNCRDLANSTDRFVRRLTCSVTIDETTQKSLSEEANVIGYDLSIKRSAIIICFKGFFQDYLQHCPDPTFQRERVIDEWKQKIEKTIATFFSKNRDMITAYLGGNRFVVFKALGDSDEEKFSSLLKTAHSSIFGPLKVSQISSIEVGFGKAYSGLEGLNNSFHEAEFALELGQIFLPKHKTYYFGDMGILFVLADGDRRKKIQFANQLLGELDNTELVDTLEAFFENNLNITDTADHLGIHRNTVLYRLDRLTENLKLDPRKFSDAVTIKIALILQKISYLEDKSKDRDATFSD